MTQVLKLVQVGDFGDRVSKWRLASKLSVSKCAKAIGVTRGYWYRIESEPDLTIGEQVYLNIVSLMEKHQTPTP